MNVREVNFDGLVGPTHNYGGLSFGNVASSGNAGTASSPKTAALQGIQKMRAMLDLGLTQGVLPPHSRPHLPTLKRLGFSSIADVASQAPQLVPQLTSGAAMWAANAATVTPSVDTADGRLHLTPANLVANTHRAVEAEQSERTLRAIFSNTGHFQVHSPLPSSPAFGDEGAANHTRLATNHSELGIHLFVYGRTAGESSLAGGSYPRRHTLEASEAVARLHGISGDRAFFVRQNPLAIDGGAFHNDVVSVGNENVFLCHEDAFVDVHQIAASLPIPVQLVEVRRDSVSLADAVSSYLFNSQLVTLPDRTMALVTPSDVADNPATAKAVAGIVDDPTNPISQSLSFDLRQSMRNGGGPACLRLRVPMTDDEVAAITGKAIVDSALLDELEVWVRRHYRDSLAPNDLSDPLLAEESEVALDELTTILGLGSIYYFQD